MRTGKAWSIPSTNCARTFQADGGDMTLLNVTPRQVTVSLSGSCSGCMMTDMTLAWLQQS